MAALDVFMVGLVARLTTLLANSAKGKKWGKNMEREARLEEKHSFPNAVYSGLIL